MSDLMAHDAISAFLDNEPFDPAALGRALAEPDGRELLLDAIALRELVTADAGATVPSVQPRRRWALAGIAAAAAVVLVAGGYALGHRSGATAAQQAGEVAPAPTQVIDLKPGVNWHTRQGGN